MSQIVVATSFSSAFKAGLTDPVVFVGILLAQRLVAWLPAELRDWLVEYIVEPIGRLADFISLT